MKITQSRVKSGLLIKGISETIWNEAKSQNGGFIGMLLGVLTLFGYMLAGKGLLRGSDGVTWADEEMIRAGQDF